MESYFNATDVEVRRRDFLHVITWMDFKFDVTVV